MSLIIFEKNCLKKDNKIKILSHFSQYLASIGKNRSNLPSSKLKCILISVLHSTGCLLALIQRFNLNFLDVGPFFRLVLCFLATVSF